MSSTSILSVIQAQVTLYGLSTLMILGNIGNIFIIILFYRRRENACTMYLLCAAIINSVTLTFNGIINLYALDYGDPTFRSLFLCKFRFYSGHLLGQIGRYLSIIACIDRYMWTINYVYARFMNRPAISRYIVGLVVLFWLIIPIHIPVLVTINNGACGAFGVYYIIYQVYNAISLALLPPISMSLFGYLAYYNMRKLHSRVRPIGVNDGNNNNNNNNNNLVQRRNRELLIMVSAEATVYAMTAIPYPFILLEVAITNYMGVNKSIERREIENFLISIGIILGFLTLGTRFYIYLAVSKAFRKDFKKLFIKTRRLVVERLYTFILLRTRQAVI